MTITLGAWIRLLESADQSKFVNSALVELHSFRGEPEHLAISVGSGSTVSDMLSEAKSAVGKTFVGYKDGEYLMTEDTPIHFAFKGSLDENPHWFCHCVNDIFK